jgi:hypothetical protein
MQSTVSDTLGTGLPCSTLLRWAQSARVCMCSPRSDFDAFLARRGMVTAVMERRLNGSLISLSTHGKQTSFAAMCLVCHALRLLHVRWEVQSQRKLYVHGI